MSPLPVFDVNGNGQTYGAETDGVTPDLVAAWASNGRQGYIYAGATDSATEVPVYESDGVTQIGVFLVG